MPFGLFYGTYGLLILAVQVFFAVHAYRNGRYFWIFIIFFFPVVGSLVYLLVEYLPSVRAGGRVRSVTREVARKLNPTAEIKRLEDVVAFTPTVNNRMELARAYLAAGRREEAIATYLSCAQGIHAEDPRVLYETSLAYFENGGFAEARETFDRLRKASTPTAEQQLLSARIDEERGDLEGALAAYRQLAARAGEEGRVRCALLLQRLGRDDEAQAIFENVLRHARLSSAQYRREEKEWIDIARREARKAEAAGS